MRGAASRGGFLSKVQLFKRAAIIAAFVGMLASPVAAKELATGTGAVIDMPSGFTAGDGEGKTRFAYFDANDGMELDILIYAPGRYGSAELMAADLLQQMGSTGDRSSFTYQGHGAVIAELDFTVDGVQRKGHAVFISGATASESSYALVASTESTLINSYSPLTAAFERRGDCDSRAMVMAIILERMGIDCVLMISREYSHAMLAVDVPGGGQRFPYNGKAYLVAETTAKVGIGKIDSSQTDLSKWLAVDLGN